MSFIDVGEVVFNYCNIIINLVIFLFSEEYLAFKAKLTKELMSKQILN